MLCVFLYVEGHAARAPLVPLHVFRVERVSAANLVALIYSAFFRMFFFLTLYLQGVLHYQPIVTGLLFLPLAAASPLGLTEPPAEGSASGTGGLA